MGKLSGLLAIGLAWSALPAPAVAADDIIKLTEAPQGEDIVVSAKPDPEPDHGEVQQQVRSITHSGPMFSEPLARFERPICPGVLGLPTDAAEMVVGRIRANAERIGLDLAKDGNCEANLVIGFVGSGKADIERMLKKSGSMLSRLERSERRELVKDPGPVHAWAITTTRSLTGSPLIGADTLASPPVLGANASHSLITLANRLDIDYSVVLIDIAAIDGMTVNQLADYATMRGVARTKPVSGEASYGTILNLFDPDVVHHKELTTFDVAYLKSLYANVPNIPGVAKITAVKGAMNRELNLAASGSEQP